MPVVVPPSGWRLLASDAVPRTYDVTLAVPADHVPWGAATRRDGAALWRAEQGEEHGPLLLHAAQTAEELRLACWAPLDSAWPADQAIELARGWTGLDDDPAEFRALAAGHPVLRELDRTLGPLPLSRLPSVQEAIGRAVIGQLVQFREAERSTAQLLRLAGAELGPLRAWPRPARLRELPDWALRSRCGLSLRAARALRLAAAEHTPLALAAAQRDWAAFDRRLCAMPGVGAWTSGSARLALGDADAVPFGDYGLPALAGHGLTGDTAPPGGWTDEHLTALLEPFRPHRGRVVRLLMTGALRRTGLQPPRRAPRAAFSVHRYW